MKLRTGILLAGSETPVGDGASAPLRATVKVGDELHGAIVKHLPAPRVLAECFCGLLLRAWGFPVPEPVLIADAGKLSFASLDTAYPNLKQRIGWRDDLPVDQQQVVITAGATIACALPDAARLLAADELLANDDRNLGNILWDGAEHAYIDHERTLGNVPHTKNLMAVFAGIAGKGREIEQGAVAAALALSLAPLKELELTGELDAAPLVEYVEKRMPMLAMRILERFPKPSDLFANLPP